MGAGDGGLLVGLTMPAPRTMSARRARIIALLSDRRVSSQEDLGRVLAEEGITVTQATLSRDLDAIGATKAADDQGGHYVVAGRAGAEAQSAERADQALTKAAQELLVGADSALNVAVLHTPPGAAQFLAGHVDRSMAFDTVGTVAGDDTVIIVMRTPREATELCASLLRLADQRRAP